MIAMQTGPHYHQIVNWIENYIILMHFNTIVQKKKKHIHLNISKAKITRYT